MERLNKVLASRGVASRRKADVLIHEGRVSVNDKTVTHLGVRVGESDKIMVDGKLIQSVEQMSYLFYKPRDVVTSMSKQGTSHIVTDFLPLTPGLHPVGRLDRESEGLLIMTNDGSLTERLTHPRFKHEKEYTVTCKYAGVLDAEAIARKLMNGVKLGDGKASADHVSITAQKHGILELVITVHEGRHHLIRRMCAAVDLDVTRLIRTRIAGLTLGSLQPGEWRPLTPADLHRLA